MYLFLSINMFADFFSRDNRRAHWTPDSREAAIPYLDPKTMTAQQISFHPRSLSLASILLVYSASVLCLSSELSSCCRTPCKNTISLSVNVMEERVHSDTNSRPFWLTFQLMNASVAIRVKVNVIASGQKSIST